MGPKSKDAVTKALGHIIDELLQQRETGRRTLKAVEELVRRIEGTERDHEALRGEVARIPRHARNGG